MRPERDDSSAAGCKASALINYFKNCDPGTYVDLFFMMRPVTKPTMPTTAITGR